MAQAQGSRCTVVCRHGPRRRRPPLTAPRSRARAQWVRDRPRRGALRRAASSGLDPALHELDARAGGGRPPRPRSSTRSTSARAGSRSSPRRDHRRPRPAPDRHARRRGGRGRRPSCARSTRARSPSVLGAGPGHELIAPLRARAARARDGSGSAGARGDPAAGSVGGAARGRCSTACRSSPTPAFTSAPRSPPTTSCWRASRLPRHRRADDLRRQPRPARAAPRWRAALRRRLSRRASTPASRSRMARARRSRCAPAPSMRASCWPRGPGCRRARWTTGCGTAGELLAPAARCSRTGRGQLPTIRGSGLPPARPRPRGQRPAAVVEPARAAVVAQRTEVQRRAHVVVPAADRRVDVGDRDADVGLAARQLPERVHDVGEVAAAHADRRRHAARPRGRARASETQASCAAAAIAPPAHAAGGVEHRQLAGMQRRRQHAAGAARDVVAAQRVTAPPRAAGRRRARGR